VRLGRHLPGLAHERHDEEADGKDQRHQHQNIVERQDIGLALQDVADEAIGGGVGIARDQ
jgi:hypothetical protein